MIPRGVQFARHRSASVFFPVRAEQVFLTRPVFRNCRDEVRNVQEMLVIHVLRNAVTSPCAAPHAQREVKTVVESTAVPECMGLVDQHAHYIGSFGQYTASVRLLRMQADRMSPPLMREDFIRARNSGVKVF